MAIGDLAVELSLDTSTATKSFSKFKQTIENKNDIKVNVQMNTGDADKRLEEISNLLTEINTTIKPRVQPNVQMNDLQRFKQLWDSFKDKQVKISAVGEGIENLGKSMSNVLSFDSNTRIGKFMSFFTKGIGYSAIYRSVSSMQSAFTDAISEGINRYDTINVSKRTLGVILGQAENATDQINSMIDTVDKNIEGLPTTMDQALQHITTFTAINGDLSKSTKLFNAMNDAVLTFGGSTDMVDNVVTQYSQIMGTKMDSRTFLSMQSSGLTPVLTAVAKKFNMTLSEFKENFTGVSPTISLDQFEEALIELDEQGGYGLEKLSDMAKASVATITNAISLLKTRLTKAFASITEAVDNMVQKFTGKTMYEIILGWSDVILNKGNEVANWINNNQDKIADFFNKLKGYFQDLKAEVSKFDIKSFFQGVADLKPVVDGVIEMFKIAYNRIKQIASFLGGGDSSRGLGRFVASWILLAKALTYTGKAIKIASPVLALLSTMDKFKFVGIGKLAKYAKALKNPLDTLAGGTNAKNVAQKFDMDAFKTMGAKHLDKIANIAEIALVGGVVLEWATVLKKVDKALDGVDGADLAMKLGGIATAIGSFELLFNATQVMAIGLSKVEGLTNPLTAKDKFIALAEMIVEGGVLFEFAYALGEFNKRVPSITSSDIGGKLATLGVAITELSALATALGAVTLTPLGFSTLIGLGEMFVEGGALYVFATSLAKFNKVNMTKSVTQIGQLKQVLSSLGDITIKDTNIDTASLKTISEAMPYLAKIGKYIGSLNKLEEVNGTAVKSKVDAIKSVLNDVDWDKLSLADPVDFQNVEATSKALGKLVKIPEKLNGFIASMGAVDTTQLTSDDNLFDKLSGVIDELNNNTIMTRLNEMGKNVENVTNASNAITTLGSIVDSLNEFAGKAVNMSSETILKGITDLTSILSEMVDANVSNKLSFFIKELGKSSKSYTNASTAVTGLQSIANIFNEIQNVTLDTAKIQQLISSVQEAIKSMNGLVNTNVIEKINTGDLATKIGEVNSYIETYKSVITALQGLQSMTIDTGAIQNLNNSINTALQAMAIVDMSEITNNTEQAQAFINQYKAIIEQLKAIGESQETISALGTTLANSMVTGFTTADFQPIYDKVVEIANQIGSESNKSLFRSVGNTLGKALSSGLKSGTSASGVVNKLTSSLTSDETLSAVASSGSTIGKTIMDNIKNQIKTVTVKTETKDTSSSKKDKSGHSSTGGLVYRAYGGAIGGVDWKRKGTDTVPTMLTPGEFVIRRNAVKKYGMNFFDRLNSMDIQGALGMLRNGSSASNFGAKTYNVVNNKTINNYDNRSVSIKGSERGSSDRLKAGRFMRALA